MRSGVVVERDVIERGFVDAQTGRRFVDVAYSDFRRFVDDLQTFAGLPKRRKATADA